MLYVRADVRRFVDRPNGLDMDLALEPKPDFHRLVVVSINEPNRIGEGWTAHVAVTGRNCNDSPLTGERATMPEFQGFLR